MGSKDDLGFIDNGEGFTAPAPTATPTSFDNNLVGQTQSYFSNKGMGWMFETDDDFGTEGMTLTEELDIDFEDIVHKIRCVIFPYNIDRKAVSQPDFWGPLAIVLAYAFIILWGQLEVVWWVISVWVWGSFLIFVLARSLGAEVSFCETIAVIGYSLIPLVILAATLPVVQRASAILALVCKGLATGWSTWAAASLLVTQEIEGKSMLLMYPILLLFVYFMSLCY